MAGFSQGGGIGLVLSRWMTDGDPGQDVLAMDVARFGVFATPRYTKTKVIENYRRRFRLAFPNEELPAARPLRRTPVYDRLKAAGAVFGANFGLEHALWFAPEGVPPIETPTYRRSEAFPHVRAECEAVRSAVGIYETSNYGKYEISGAGARALLDRLLACRLPRPGRMAIAPMLIGARPHRRRPLRRLPRAGPLPPHRLGLRRGLPHALVLEPQPAAGRACPLRRLDADRLLDRRAERAHADAAPRPGRHLGRAPSSSSR